MNEATAILTAASHRRDDRGAGLVEYAFLLALIAVLCIGSLHFLGGNVSSNLSTNTSSMFGP